MPADTSVDERTWADLVWEVWHSWGFHGPLAPWEIDYVLWEETAFPMGSQTEVRQQCAEFFVFQALPAPRGPNGGRSRCPVCGRRWWVTPSADCMLPACGCYGHDTSAPCHGCGLSHALSCKRRRAVAGGDDPEAPAVCDPEAPEAGDAAG